MAEKVTLLPPSGGTMQFGSVAEPIIVCCQHIYHSDGTTATEILTLAGAQIDANGHLILTLYGGGTLDVGAAKGDTGATPQFSIGSVTTGNPGTQVQVTITGTAKEPVLNLVIPQGDTGATPQFSIGSVATGNPGTQVQVTITGTAKEPVLNLVIPQGETGSPGAGVPSGGTAGQLMSKTESSTEWVAGVLATRLNDLSLLTNSPITNIDTVITALGKLQAQTTGSREQKVSFTLCVYPNADLTSATVAIPFAMTVDTITIVGRTASNATKAPSASTNAVLYKDGSALDTRAFTAADTAITSLSVSLAAGLYDLRLSAVSGYTGATDKVSVTYSGVRAW